MAVATNFLILIATNSSFSNFDNGDFRSTSFYGDFENDNFDKDELELLPNLTYRTGARERKRKEKKEKEAGEKEGKKNDQFLLQLNLVKDT